jgi:hypothetical protein
MDGDATRGRALLEESREAVVVLDDTDRVIGASRRARQSIDGLREGRASRPACSPATQGSSRSSWRTTWAAGASASCT